jgi:nitrous oxidase accessory protein
MALHWHIRALALAAAFAGAVLHARAAEQVVRPGEPLDGALASAEPGDVIRLAAGVHRGPVVIDRTFVLEGEPGAVIEGTGEGSVITLSAPDTIIRGLTVRGSGMTIAEEDSGIFVGKAGDRAIIEGNRLEGNLFGIYLMGPQDAIARGNEIIGLRDRPAAELGSGISVWNAPGSQVLDNVIRFGRDGIFANTSRNNVFRGNRISDLRFAVHYMYTNESEVSGNVSRGNDVGYAIMFSHRLEVRDNLSEGDRDHGLLLNYANHSTVEGNRVRQGGEKCVFIYNANFNELRGNRFDGCEIGIHFTAGSEQNRITNNAFVGNRTQVKYVGTRLVDWSAEGRGNYWSDNPAFDLDGNGIADNPYRPNGVVDQVLWRNPLAKLLLTSPAVQTIRWAQSQLPALQPGGVIDPAPLMRPPGFALAATTGPRSSAR